MPIQNRKKLHPEMMPRISPILAPSPFHIFPQVSNAQPTKKEQVLLQLHPICKLKIKYTLYHRLILITYQFKSLHFRRSVKCNLS